MDTEHITKIVTLMEQSNLSEFEIEQEGLKLRICRGQKEPSPMVIQPHAAMPSVSFAEEAPVVQLPGKLIKSPMVGTFYSAVSPDSPPFVKIGDKVSANSVVCILEAMKVMNEIHAEIAGSVTEILVENGQTVEFGQPLFRIS